MRVCWNVMKDQIFRKIGLYFDFFSMCSLVMEGFYLAGREFQCALVNHAQGG